MIPIKLVPNKRAVSGTARNSNRIDIRLPFAARSSSISTTKSSVRNAVAAALSVRVPEDAQKIVKKVKDEEESLGEGDFKNINDLKDKVIDNVVAAVKNKDIGGNTTPELKAVSKKLGVDVRLSAVAYEYLSNQDLRDDALTWIAIEDVNLLSQTPNLATREKISAKLFATTESSDLSDDVEQLKVDVAGNTERITLLENNSGSSGDDCNS